MVIWLLRFLRGYLDVVFFGKKKKKILSVLAKERISVWRLKYSDGKIKARIFAKDYKRLRKLRKNTEVKIKIAEKHGFPFFARKYRKRSGFMLGIIAFFVILKFLSTFIWVINIEGNKTVSSEEIIKSLNQIGIEEGMKVSKLDAKNNAQSLLLLRDDLAWASLNIESCVLNVNVSEIKKSVREGVYVPSNLVARTDGIIRKIDASSGNVMVKVGENVHKGDILVSGIIESLSSTVFVKSNAAVIAQVEKEYVEKADFVQKLKVKTGKVCNEKVISILGVRVPLFLAKKHNPAEVEYEVCDISLLGSRIPVSIIGKKYSYYEDKEFSFTVEELEKQLSSGLNDYLENETIEGYIPVGTEYITDDSGVTISHRYLCDEDITMEKEIIMGQ